MQILCCTSSSINTFYFLIFLFKKQIKEINDECKNIYSYHVKKVIKESVLNVCVRINREQKSKQIYYVYIILWMTVRSDSLSNMDDIDKLLSELDLPTVSASPTLLKNSQRKSRDIDDLLDLTADTSKMKVQSQTFNHKSIS